MHDATVNERMRRYRARLKELGVKDFPTMTLMLMNMSNFLTTYWYIAAAIAIRAKNKRYQVRSRKQYFGGK